MKLIRKQVRCRAIFGRQVTMLYGSNLTTVETNHEL